MSVHQSNFSYVDTKVRGYIRDLRRPKDTFGLHTYSLIVPLFFDFNGVYMYIKSLGVYDVYFIILVHHADFNNLVNNKFRNTIQNGS